MADSQTNDNNTCVVCFKNVLYFSIGECDHPVCFECSTRMRVLCLQNECPICRNALARVVFTDSIQPYRDLRNRVFPDRLFERQYKIGFCSEEIKNAYGQLLENCCELCPDKPPFRVFSALSDHIRKIHERFFCELCVKHLKIFTSERRCYTRKELAHHRRKGDIDDTSHRGHPLCEFCEDRFMDADELYRHLRKEHLYCHLCDADGKNFYYASHKSLALHFRNDHYLCEEGDCVGQHLTAVFRSEIDLKAHKATVHGRGMTRGAARQTRTLDLQFNITPHPVAQRAPRERDRGGEGGNGAGGGAASPPPPAPAPAPRIDTRSDEQFPRLSAAPPAPALLLAPSGKSYKGTDALARNDKNFPALDGGVSSARPAPTPPVTATLLRHSKPSVSIQLQSQPVSASNFRLTQTSGNRISIPAPPPARRPPAPLSDDDFPSLSVPKDDHPSLGAGTVQPPKVALINIEEMQALKINPGNSQQKKPQLSSEAFPALSSNSAPAAPPQWITVSKSKEKIKPAKPEPPPQPKTPNFNPVADFPTLPGNNIKAKSKKTPQPVPQIPSSQSSDNMKSNKKEKKKQNNNARKENISQTNQMNGANDKKSDAANVSIKLNNDQSVSNNKLFKTIVETSSTVNVNPEKKKNVRNGDFALTAKDYPPLSAKSENAILSKKIPNGAVPPGFKTRPPCDGMTFTNSAGQTFSAPVHTYIPPPDFEQRNRALVKKFAVALGDTAAMEEFKRVSRAFRESMISADEFYEHCRSALGHQLESVFLELVALLPDIAKQQELVVGRSTSSQLKVCDTCGQLLALNDDIAHDTAHWPALGAR